MVVDDVLSVITHRRCAVRLLIVSGATDRLSLSAGAVSNLVRAASLLRAGAPRVRSRRDTNSSRRLSVDAAAAARSGRLTGARVAYRHAFNLVTRHRFSRCRIKSLPDECIARRYTHTQSLLRLTAARVVAISTQNDHGLATRSRQCHSPDSR